MVIRKNSYEYRSGGTTYRGTLISGERPPSAVVVLLPDWRGQSSLSYDHAAFLVAEGCVVIIADLYGNGFSPTDPNQVGEMVQNLIEHRDRGVAALAACFAALDEHAEHIQPGLPRFCLGYSAGAMIALDYGRSGAHLAGIMVASGLLKTAAPGVSTRLAAPLLIMQGTQDQVSPMAVIQAVIAEMDEAGNDFRVELYGQAHHAFDNPDAGTDPMARLVYSPTAAARSRRAIAEFITEQTQSA